MSIPPPGKDPLAQLITESFSDAPTDQLPQLVSLLGIIDTDESPAATTDEVPDRLLHWLAQAARGGAELTLGIPGSDRRGTGWIGRRAVWWPEGVPTGQAVGVASSRLGRMPDQQPAWFAALRTVAARRQADGEYLVSVASAAASEYVTRAAELFGTRLLEVDICEDDHGSLTRWLDGVRQSETASHTTRSKCRAFVSPLLANGPFPSDDQQATQLAQYPIADRVLLAMSDQVYVLRLRPRGNLIDLLQRWLHESPRQTGRVHLLENPPLVPQSLRDDLMSRGALGWYLIADREKPSRSAGSGAMPGSINSASRQDDASALRVLAEIPSYVSDQFLVHCTRRRHGPWPDETRVEYLDHLVNSESTADHSPLAALKRIVTQRLLVATGIGIRGGAEVVSFTAVPLAELHRLRIFRPHRGRWDFEPYGVAMQRDWLIQRGAQLVRYADAQSWTELTASERPFFQRARSTTASGLAIDWTVEQEWRHLGNLPFEDLPKDKGLLFVPTRREAEQLAIISRWPVVVLGEACP